MPLIPFVTTVLTFPPLGMAKAALELFLEKASGRGLKFTVYERQEDAAVTHLQVGEASIKIDAAKLMLRRSVQDLSETAASGRKMRREQRARIWRDATAASRMIWEAVDLLAGASGSSFAQTGNP